jgi:hypothetical protein
MEGIMKPLSNITTALFTGTLIIACSGGNFKSGDSGSAEAKKGPGPGDPPPPAQCLSNCPFQPSSAPGSIVAHFNVVAGDNKLIVSANFKPKSSGVDFSKDAHVDFDIDIPTVSSTTAGSVEAAVAAQVAKLPISAAMDFKMADKSYVVTITVPVSGLVVKGKLVGAQTVTLTQSANNPNWSKDEGSVSAFGSLSDLPNPEDCSIVGNANSKKGLPAGTHFVILTNPAPCDFKLPSVIVGSDKPLTEVPIGTYWTSWWDRTKTAADWRNPHRKAHDFDLVSAPQTSKGTDVRIDNGFILLQPDGISYLLVDAGVAQPEVAGYKSAKQIANDVSHTLKFGDTVLKQPNPGSVSDNFASATVFKKGSVIGIYDDTPDMGGTIAIDAFATKLISVDTTLSWDAKYVQANP